MIAPRKDELALEDTHTYNPPHRNAAQAVLAVTLTGCVFPAPVRMGEVCSRSTCAGWLGRYLGAVAVFPENLRSDSNEDESSGAYAGVGELRIGSDCSSPATAGFPTPGISGSGAAKKGN